MIYRTNKLKPQTTVEYDGDKQIITHVRSIDDLLANNQKLRNSPTNGFTPDRQWRHIGDVDFFTWMEWTKKYPELIHGDPKQKRKRLKYLLKQSENAQFRTVGGGI